MRISKEIQLGKAGEHFACTDLLLKGYNAFLSDQGLPFDVLVEVSGKVYRGQVKTVSRTYQYHVRKDGVKPHRSYRFITRHGSRSKNRVTELDEVDFFVFVVLPKKIIAYMWVKDMISKNTGKVNQLIEFKDKDFVYSKDRLGRRVKGKYIQDFTKFEIS